MSRDVRHNHRQPHHHHHHLSVYIETAFRHTESYTTCAFYRRRPTVVILCLVMMAFVLIVGLIVAITASVASPAAQHVTKDGDRVVRLVQTVFRHGPRTPADTYPTDPYINATFYPNGWGQLTNPGKQYMFETGEWLNKRYGKFIGDYYKPDAIWAQTTGVTRTQMTMALVLAGLLPPKDTPMQWNPKLNWQPVPIFSQPLDEDSLLLVRTPCPRYYEAAEEVFELPEVKKILDDNAKLFAELTKHTGMPIRTPDDVQSIYSTLRAEEEFGLQLPAWTKQYYPERLLPLTKLSYVYNVYTDEMKKFKAGPFFQKMQREWRERSSGTLKPADRKMFLYTGHDSTIVNVLAALDLWRPDQLPVYGIMAIFELVEDTLTKEWGVQIYLRESAESGAVPLTIPGCDHFCQLDKLEKLTQKLQAVDIRKECEAKNKDFTTPAPSGP